MNAEPPSVEEALRLDVLRGYGVLDTAPERALDDLVSLAAELCEAPIARISLVDEHRQWFKAMVGLETPETPRDVSFCAHTLQLVDLLIVPDATQDPRFAMNPTVTGEPGIRFYAGAPLRTRGGVNLGTLCVLDRVPRTLSPVQEQALRVLAQQVMMQLELRAQERKLAKSERFLRTIIDSEPECVKLIGKDGSLQMMNRAGLAMVQAETFDEVAGQRIYAVLDPASLARIKKLTKRVFRGESGTLEYQIVGLKGARLWLETHAAPLRDERGEVTALLAITRNITGRKQAEERSRLGEIASRRLAAIVESSDDAIFSNDRGGIVTSWNNGAKEIFGYDAEEMIGASITRIVPEDLRDEEARITGKLWNGGRHAHFETARMTKDGRRIDVSITASPIRDSEGQVIAISKVARDITMQKAKEEARHMSEARYRTLFEFAPEGILIADADGRFIDANPSICTMLGYTRAECIELDATDMADPAEHEIIAPAMMAVKSGSHHRREWRLRRKDGSVLRAEVVATQMPDGSLLSMVRDVTERRRAEERFSHLFESDMQGVAFWRLNGEVTEANDQFLRIVGRTRADLQAGRINWRKMTPPGHSEADRRAMEEIAQRGACEPFEKEYLRGDGACVPVLVGAARFEDNPDEGISFVLDLTEWKKLEQQFLRVQRMESIGVLAGGIAHDLNNALGPIVIALELLKMKFHDASSQELLDIVTASARRGTEMVRQVLSFARGVQGPRLSVQLGDLVRDIEKIANETFLKHVQVRTMVPRYLWKISGDSTQLHQVLLNLCMNARDAMPRGGTIRISAENVMLDEHYAALHLDATPGAHVCLQVEDTGAGMSPEVLEKAFDPFFTTKEHGKGTGLGLSTSLGIIKSHGGFIQVESEPGKGSRFKVYLPAQVEEVPSHLPETPAEMPRGHGELILVVDDEAAVRQITQRTLEEFGYRVIVATDGAQGVEMYAAQKTEVALIFTDMMMPVMDGTTAIRKFRHINPSVRIVATSGLVSHATSVLADDLGLRDFLTKPYTARTLLETLRRALGRNEDVAAN